MEFEQRSEGKALVVKPLEKRVDARVAGELKQYLADMVTAGHTMIALNLSDVEFVDSSGLGAIVSALKLLGGKGDLVLFGSRPPVLSLFKLTRMDKVLRMFAAEGDAVAALS